MVTLHFIKEILEYCSNTPVFLVYRAPWYKEAFKQTWINISSCNFRKEKSHRKAGYLKHRTKIFFNNINVNFKKVMKKIERGLKDRVVLQHYNFFLKIFELYYIYLR